MLTHQQTGLPATPNNVANTLVQRDGNGTIDVDTVNAVNGVSTATLRLADFPDFPVPPAPTWTTTPYTANDGGSMSGGYPPVNYCFMYGDGNGHYSQLGPTVQVTFNENGDSQGDVDNTFINIPELPDGVTDIWLCDDELDTFGSVAAYVGGQFQITNPYPPYYQPPATAIPTEYIGDPTSGALTTSAGFAFGNGNGLAGAPLLSLDTINGIFNLEWGDGDSLWPLNTQLLVEPGNIVMQAAYGGTLNLTNGYGVSFVIDGNFMTLAAMGISINPIYSLGFFGATPVPQQTGSVVDGLIAYGLFTGDVSLFSQRSANAELRTMLYEAGMTYNPAGVAGTLDLLGGTCNAATFTNSGNLATTFQGGNYNNPTNGVPGTITCYPSTYNTGGNVTIAAGVCGVNGANAVITLGAAIGGSGGGGISLTGGAGGNGTNFYTYGNTTPILAINSGGVRFFGLGNATVGQQANTTELRTALGNLGLFAAPGTAAANLNLQNGLLSTGNLTSTSAINSAGTILGANALTFVTGAATSIGWSATAATCNNLTITGQSNSGTAASGNAILKGGGSYPATITAGGQLATSGNMSGNITLAAGYASGGTPAPGQILLQSCGAAHMTVGGTFATGQNLGFFGVTPVVQATSTTDIKTALVNYGLLVSGTAPLNLGVGALTTGSQTISDGYNVVLGTTTGTQFGTATTQKLSFYGKTPIVQPSGAAQAAVTLWDTPNAIGSLSISATYIQSEHQALRNDCESLAGDVRNIAALVNALQAALLALGQIKGGA